MAADASSQSSGALKQAGGRRRRAHTRKHRKAHRKTRRQQKQKQRRH